MLAKEKTLFTFSIIFGLITINHPKNFFNFSIFFIFAPYFILLIINKSKL